MTDEQLRDEVMTFLLAGHETTALALSWALYLLSQDARAEGKLHEEVDRLPAGKLPTVLVSLSRAPRRNSDKLAAISRPRFSFRTVRPRVCRAAASHSVADCRPDRVHVGLLGPGALKTTAILPGGP